MAERPLRYACVAVLASTLLWASSCDGSNPSMEYETYDRSCSTNSDCAAVWSGDVCTCDNAGAINSSELESYRDERTDLQEQCNSVPSCSFDSFRAVCNAGTCVIDEPLPDIGEDTSEPDDDDAGPDDTGGDAADVAEDVGDTGDDPETGPADAADGNSDTTPADSSPSDTAVDGG